MTFEIQPSLLLLPYAISGIVTIGLTIFGLYRLRVGGWDDTTAAFVGIVFGVTLWTVARFFEFLFVNETITQAMLVLLYVGYGTSTMSALIFGLAFTGRKQYLQPRYIALIFAFPAFALLIAATSPYHDMFWSGEFVTAEGWWGEVLVFDRDFQPTFMLYLVYTVGGVLLGLGLLLRMAFNSPSVYRWQAIAFSVGGVTTPIVGTMFVLEIQPFVPDFLDMTPVAFAFMGVCFGYAIFRHQLLDLVPIARDAVISSMRDGYVVVDTKQRIVDFNNAAQELLGGDELIGNRVQAEIPGVASVLDNHVAGEQTEEELEVEIDGEQRFLLVNVTSLYEDDQFIGELLLVRDITDRRAVQKRYQALIENSSDLTLVIEEDATISYASPSVRTITGVDPETIEGQNAFSFVHKDDREAFEDAFETLLETPGEAIRYEYRVMDSEGNWLYMEASIRNLLENPFVEGMVVNAREITERKKREEELREANDELERANEQLEQFASVISHDLRNPINVAKGHVEIAEETGREESFEKVDESLERMEAIIDDVLTLAREGESIGETEPVTLESVCADAWDHVATDGATLEVVADLTFEGDPDRLMQLFENLFRNAHEHVGEDVTVRVGTTDDAFYVEDDGPGIPEEKRDQVLESGHTTNRDGTGLGLSIVTQIAEAHGWEVNVTEGSDGGARFEFVGIDPAT